jgi:tol-pal system protein YbgF
MNRPDLPCFPIGPLPVALALFAIAVLAGCATTRQTMEKQLQELESQVVTLKAEKANLVARNTALDDRVLVLEAQKAACREGDRRARQLQVVRLHAASEPEEEAVEERPAPPPPGNRAEDRERPVLRLTGAGEPAVPAARIATRAPLPELPGPGAGDNLGVVPMGGGAGGAGDDPMTLFQDGYRAHANGDHGPALELLARFVKEHPEHAFADDALFWRGECFLAQGKALKGIGEFERLLARYPGSDKGAQALYRIGFAYDQLGDPGKAGEYYFKVVERHPGTDAARKASRRVAAIREAGGAGGLMPTSAMR